MFRQWLQNWKKWKGFKRQGRVELKFPVEEIVKYINSWIPNSQIEVVINQRFRRAQARILFYSSNTLLLKTLEGKPFLKLAIGTQTLVLPGTHNSDLSSIPISKLATLDDSYRDFKTAIKNIESSLLERLPTSIKKLEEWIKANGKVLEKIKLLCSVLYLLESENPDINLDIILYFIPFKYLSSHFEDLTFLSTLIVQKGFISPHSLQDVLRHLEREVGDNSLSYRRWKDYFFIERVLFLLRKLEGLCRHKIVYQEKVKVAESLFYILYHLQVPLVAKISLKILKRLDINLKEGIRTPFQREYRLLGQKENGILGVKQQFRLRDPKLNNIELLCSKISKIFHNKKEDLLQERFQVEDKKDKQPSEKRYHIILSLNQEEDLYWLIKVLYYIDELEIKRGEKRINQIKDYEEYLLLKNRKKQEHKKQSQQQPNSDNEKQKTKQKEGERILSTLSFKFANIDPQFEKQLPIGWFFNYCHAFGDPLEKPGSVVRKGQAAGAQPSKNPKNKNNSPNNGNKRNWNSPIFTKLVKKYEQLASKPLQQPKEGDGSQVKTEFVKSKNIVNRMRRYLQEVSCIIDQLGRNGYYLFRQDLPQIKMKQICQIITIGSNNRLKDIPFDLKNAEVKARLSLNDSIPNFSSKLKLTIIQTQHYPFFESLLSFQAHLNIKSDFTSLYYTYLGKRELALQDSGAYMPYQQFIALDQPTEDADIEFGKQWIEAGFSRMKKKYERIYLHDYPNQIYYLGQGGIDSGLKDNILIPATDSTLTLQTSPFDSLMTQPLHPSQNPYEETDLPEELMDKIQKILQRGGIKVHGKQDVQDYLLLTFYLKKLNGFSLSLVERERARQFALKLSKFSQRLQSFKELSLYELDTQKLLLKLFDNEHERWQLFGTYVGQQIADELSQFLIQLPLQKLNSSNQVRHDALETHSYVKSGYLLGTHPPQIEQNKLLKYWEKTILPKMYEFVKTTLKPIEIDDFWQQMRRALRIYDHTEAKRVAFIICDNKLPAGAIIPDANHNWNSLEAEDISVGDHVLVRSRPRDAFTPLLAWGAQQQKLAKVIFIDARNSSVLVRYRVEQLGLFGFTWVPVNCLVAPEKEVMHLSTQSIFEELQRKLEGMVYIHAKQCLTKLAGSVPEVDNLKLIRQTILDLFVRNPISGCFQTPRPIWSMRGIFQKMIQNQNLTVLQLLQKEFCSIKGIDLSLNSQKMTVLNRFDSAKALIVSFKKETRFSMCSGLRFFSDKYGYNEVAHVYSAKNERGDIEPLQFHDPNIFCRYYSNKECLPIIEQNNYKSYPIQVTVFAIDEMWTIGCYIGEVICQIANQKPTLQYLQLLRRLNSLFIKWILRKIVTLLASYIAKLVSKISLTIATLCDKNKLEVTPQRLGITIDQQKDLLGWIGRIQAEESKQVVALYSALLQNLSQMAASLLLRLSVTPPLPDHIKASIDLIRMLKQLDNFKNGKKGSLGVGDSSGAYQWQRVLQIRGVPVYLSGDTVLKKIKQIVAQSKGKILCPESDVWLKGQRCVILVDGWDITELVEEDVIQKIQQQEEEKQQDEGESTMGWMCSVCTFENPLAYNVCEMCQNPAPPPAKTEIVYDAVQATDLKLAEKKLKEKEGRRFEEVKNKIIKFFQDQWKSHCELLQKRNRELEEANKKQDPKKKKGTQRQQIREMPERPKVHLITGSRVFEDEVGESFLSERFQKMPSDLRKLAEGRTSYEKFKNLLNLGYDLWGDNIVSENATLIPFNQLYLLMDYIQTQICKGSSSVLSYSQQSIRVLSQIPLVGEEPINYIPENDIGVRAKYKQLASLKSYNIRYSWRVVKELNLAASKCLQFVNMDLRHDRTDSVPRFTDALGRKLQYFRALIMGVIKLQLSQKIMQKTSVARETDQIPKIYLERLRIREERGRDRLVTAKEKEDHLFTKAHDQFLRISPAFLRPFKPRGADPYLSFIVTFKGENVMGEAGPYRQFFTDIARELEPAYKLGLFIASPNNRYQSGQHRSKWVVNPKANSTYHFSLFEYVGVLMGCCIRTGAHIALDLPSTFWKALTREQITDQDLQQVDIQFVSMTKILRDCPSEDLLDQATETTNGGPLTWTYRSSDEEVHQIIPNGKNIQVKWAELPKYIEALRFHRANEASLQIKRILVGLGQLVPAAYLNCLTGEQLRLLVCGRPRVDVQLLRKHTKYSGDLNEESRRIVYFWQIMRELEEKERLKIIRFCWGQERLPVNSEEFERNNIRFMIKPMVAGGRDQDKALPKADTCFFNIELPDYSTKAIMKEKILLAVNLDNVSINADENMNQDDNPLMNQIEEYGGDEEYDEDPNNF